MVSQLREQCEWRGRLRDSLRVLGGTVEEKRTRGSEVRTKRAGREGLEGETYSTISTDDLIPRVPTKDRGRVSESQLGVERRRARDATREKRGELRTHSVRRTKPVEHITIG